MTRTIEAVFDGNVLRPEEPLDLRLTRVFALQSRLQLKLRPSHTHSSELLGHSNWKAHPIGPHE
jgi:hypothetical protein